MTEVDRRRFVAGGVAGLLAATAARADGRVDAPSPLSSFVASYMTAYNAPGMIVGTADAEGGRTTAAYGYADLDARRPIQPDERFHIGSISKSFAALMIMQLVDEGKVRLDGEVTRYLPGLALRTPFAPVTVHHLLCHTSGLPGEAPPPGWPDAVPEQAFAPGSRFHYSNMGYEWLGRIIVAAGGESWPAALHRRILDPLGMTQTSALIGAGTRCFEVPSYVRREDDRPFPRRGALTRSGPQTFVGASGCIASTADDMNRYMAMLARRGATASGRLVSTEGFALMTRRHADAAEIGPGVGYGYGWMIERDDGAEVIRHTGGMVSFMSSIHVDLTAGLGAFASINAQQNYRPVPVTAYALALDRARVKGTAVPAAPALDTNDARLADYAGRFVASDGSAVEVTATRRRLSLAVGGRTVALEPLGDDKFACPDPDYRLFTFLFRRAVPLTEARDDVPNPVLSLGWGRNGYVRRGARLPRFAESDSVTLPPGTLRGYEGCYAADGSWLGSVRVAVREGRLWLDSIDGAMPLAALGSDRFRFADEKASPETVSFSAAPISPRVMAVGGTVLTRIGDADYVAN